jgi:hypothetical protein
MPLQERLIDRRIHRKAVADGRTCLEALLSRPFLDSTLRIRFRAYDADSPCVKPVNRVSSGLEQIAQPESFGKTNVNLCAVRPSSINHEYWIFSPPWIHDLSHLWPETNAGEVEGQKYSYFASSSPMVRSSQLHQTPPRRPYR